MNYHEFDTQLSRIEARRARFWQTRESLSLIHQAARAGLASPWAVLVTCLARVIALAPPAVVLPPRGGYGSPGSLNLLAAVAAKPGDGKGASAGIAARLLPFPALPLLDDPSEADYGSYEGLLKLFGSNKIDPDTKQPTWQWNTRQVLISISEVDKLTATSGRAGDMSTSILRQAFSGERLGVAYSDPSKAARIPAGEYRLSALIHVQPGQSGPLFASASGGLLQRLLWAPGEDRRAELVDPPDGRLALPSFRDWGSRRNGQLNYPDVMANEIRDHQLARARGEITDDPDGLDAHAVFVRCKAAVGLAFLDGRTDPTVQDWALAGDVLDVSRLTRQYVRTVLDAARLEAAAERGLERGAEHLTAKDYIDGEQSRRITAAYAKFLRKMAEKPNGHEFTKSELTQWVGVSRNHSHARPAIAERARNELLADGLIVQNETSQKYELTPDGRRMAESLVEQC